MFKTKELSNSHMIYIGIFSGILCALLAHFLFADFKNANVGNALYDFPYNAASGLWGCAIAVYLCELFDSYRAVKNDSRMEAKAALTKRLIATMKLD
jgi:hypothetical protein